ncbi:MAG: hypothetical protein ACKO0V_12395 [bacterium]
MIADRRFLIPAALMILLSIFIHEEPFADDFDREPIFYRDSNPANAISRLQADLDSGKQKLEYDPTWGYLASVLKSLDIPAESQALVFSKTSLQRERISPETPRALYFNDDVYIGFCQSGDVLEISVADPRLGTVFYTLDQEKVDKPLFTRQVDACLLCHGGSQTQSVPGHLMRSVFSDAAGQPILASGTYRTDQTSAFKERFGGWYVTGEMGKQYNLGNKIFQKRDSFRDINWEAGMNLHCLDSICNINEYPRKTSDVVALLVLGHQSEMHNRITRANFQTRQALHYEQALNKGLGEKPDHRWPSTTSRIKSACEPLLEYLFFQDELKLESPVSSDSGFIQAFEKRGPRDSKGRSLREFDLKTRIFKYPCSYLVYSESFRQLPDEAMNYILLRMNEILSGKDKSDKFKHLSETDKTAILAILSETGILKAPTDKTQRAE